MLTAIRHVPLNLLHVTADGNTTVEHEIYLKEKEIELKLDTTLPFKLNADGVGFCKYLAPPYD